MLCTTYRTPTLAFFPFSEKIKNEVKKKVKNDSVKLRVLVIFFTPSFIYH